jgi:hypothetical protein
MTKVINNEVVEAVFGCAELYKDGLLEVSDTDSAIICMATDVPDKGAARIVLMEMLGHVGRVLPIAQEGVDF